MSMSDVWDLTKKAHGDHVLIALTPNECAAVIDALKEQGDGEKSPHSKNLVGAARREIVNSLRDQKGGV